MKNKSELEEGSQNTEEQEASDYDENYQAKGFSADDVPEEGLEENGIKKFPDGSIAIDGDSYPVQRTLDEDDHDQNLAEILDESVLLQIGNSLRQSIEEDKESQAPYFQNIANLINLLGIKSATSGAENADGIPEANSTALFETWLHYIATVMGAIFPSKGAVDAVILGEEDEKLKNLSYRITAFFNFFLYQIDKGFEKELKRTVAWSIFDSIYSKVFIDPVLGRPTHRMIKPEDFIVNRDLSSHLCASRKTQVHRMDKREFELRKILREYRDIEIMPTSLDGTDNVIQEELDDIIGYERSGGGNTPDFYEIYECHVEYRIKEDPSAKDIEIPLPYIITLDAHSAKVLRIQRNWKKEDYLKKNREYFINWSLLPALDGEGYGLNQYAAQSAQTASTIMRQLIMAGMYSNFPGGVYAAGLTLEENDIRPAPGQFVKLQTGGISLDQAIMPLPYKEPSGALNDLKNQIEDNIRKPSAIINDAISEMAPRAPAASVLAMLENYQRVPNFVIQGYHKSFELMLGLFKDRFAEWLPEGQPYPFLVPGGKHVIMRSDFEEHVQIVPSNDPSLQNSMYRFMRAEVILNNARQDPDIHDLKYANELFYKNLGISPEEISKLLPDEEEEEEPVPLDLVTENQNFLNKIPVVAGIEQEQDAHIMGHGALLNNPSAQQDPEIIAAIQAHIREHEALKLLINFQAITGMHMPEDPAEVPMDVQNQISVAAAQMAMQQQQQQQASPDPMTVQAQAALTEAQASMEEVRVIEMRAQLEAENKKLQLMLEQQKLELDKYKFDAELPLKEAELQIKFSKSQTEDQIKSAETENKISIDQSRLDLDQTKLAADLMEKSQRLTNEITRDQGKLEQEKLSHLAKTNVSPLGLST